MDRRRGGRWAPAGRLGRRQTHRAPGLACRVRLACGVGERLRGRRSERRPGRDARAPCAASHLPAAPRTCRGSPTALRVTGDAATPPRGAGGGVSASARDIPVDSSQGARCRVTRKPREARGQCVRSRTATPSPSARARERRPSLLGSGGRFLGRPFVHGPCWGRGGDGLGTIQAHYAHCALYYPYIVACSAVTVQLRCRQTQVCVRSPSSHLPL